MRDRRVTAFFSQLLFEKSLLVLYFVGLDAGYIYPLKKKSLSSVRTSSGLQRNPADRGCGRVVCFRKSANAELRTRDTYTGLGGRSYVHRTRARPFSKIDRPAGRGDATRTIHGAVFR